jgi:hypothetical protein
MGVTARATIQGALKLIGVLDPAETMESVDADDGLLMLNNLVDGMNLERLNIYTITEVVASFSGATATIGPAMTIATPRPIRLETASYRIGGIDYNLQLVNSAEYDSISMKALASAYPEVMYYDSNSPTGLVYVYPVPSTSTQYRIQVMSQLVAFADLDTLYDLPQGYAKLLMYALAIELAPLYKKEPPATVMRVYLTIVRTVKRANVVVPTLDVDLPKNSGDCSGSSNLLRIQSGA